MALPVEHGGWGLTAEPALLGLVVAPSFAGFALAAAAVVAFLARTPLELALVDHRRGRRLPRTALAERIATTELAALLALVVVATVAADGAFWPPLATAAPLVAVELWFAVRSRKRRLVPELAGAIGIASVAAAIVLAASNDDAGLALGLWLVLAGRVVAALPFVRLQLARAKGRFHHVAGSDVAQAAALVLGVVAVAIDGRLLGGLAALVVCAVLHLTGARRRPPRAVILGIHQMVLGLAVVVSTAAGVIAL